MQPTVQPRAHLRAAVRALAVLGLVLALAVGCAAPPPPTIGTSLGARPAPDFRLRDATGQSVARSDFAGRPVVLTFLYTRCQDTCPLTAAKLRQTLDLLGEDGGRVALVAISTDPAGDDPQAVQEFLARFGLAGRMRYLIGTADELAPVWQAYGIAAQPNTASGEYGGHGAHAPGAAAPPAAPVLHTDATFLIDKQGRQRQLVRSDVDPRALADVLRALARE
jgi:protein SCO1/2